MFTLMLITTSWKSLSPVALGRSSKPISSSLPPAEVPERTCWASAGLSVESEWKMEAPVSVPKVALCRIGVLPSSTSNGVPIPGVTNDRLSGSAPNLLKPFWIRKKATRSPAAGVPRSTVRAPDATFIVLSNRMLTSLIVPSAAIL